MIRNYSVAQTKQVRIGRRNSYCVSFSIHLNRLFDKSFPQKKNLRPQRPSE
jgi:hypothetical protein